MTCRISHTTVDAIDAYAQSVWWSKVLDFIEDPDDPNEPGHELCPIMSRDRGQVLLFITVPDGEKKLKNRLHFDLRLVDGTRDQEVQRLLTLGHLEPHLLTIGGAAGQARAERNCTKSTTTSCLPMSDSADRLFGAPRQRSRQTEAAQHSGGYLSGARRLRRHGPRRQPE